MRFNANILPVAVALASFMAREADAIYLPGIVRLFRGEGDLTDSVTSNDGTDLSPAFANTPPILFPIETPYSGVARQVFYFHNRGLSLGSTEGLPSGSESRTIVGWAKKGSNDRYNGQFFGYGRSRETSAAYYAHFYNLNKISLDQWDVKQNFDQVLVTNIGEWFHYAATWDGTKNTVYINGEKKTEGEPALKPNTAVGFR
jgi:hypothetical protein